MADGPDGRHGPHVFVADIDVPEIDSGDRHHLVRVLRMRPGDPLTISDGRGAWRSAEFSETIEPIGPVTVVPAATPTLTVAFALVKGQRPEWAVQRLTEAGVDVIRPFVAARSVVRWDGRRAATNTARLRRVVREAAMQSRRCHMPRLEEVGDFASVTEGAGAALAERGGATPSLDHPTIVIGPEGGWSPEELSAGVPTVALGAGIYRAETAAVAAGVLLASLRAGIIAPFEAGA